MDIVCLTIMRLPFPLIHLFHAPAEAAPVTRRASEVPLAEADDSVPTMNIWNGLLMLLAIGFSHNRLPGRQRAGGRAKRAMNRERV
jgi:hypothetical protein